MVFWQNNPKQVGTPNVSDHGYCSTTHSFLVISMQVTCDVILDRAGITRKAVPIGFGALCHCSAWAGVHLHWAWAATKKKGLAANWCRFDLNLVHSSMEVFFQNIKQITPVSNVWKLWLMCDSLWTVLCSPCAPCLAASEPTAIPSEFVPQSAELPSRLLKISQALHIQFMSNLNLQLRWVKTKQI